MNRWHAAADLSVQAAAGALFAVVGTRLLLDGQPARAVLAFVCAGKLRELAHRLSGGS